MITIPAFFYRYSGRGQPTRAALAWAVLRKHSLPHFKLPKRQAARIVAEALAITPHSARRLLAQGEGVFWQKKGPFYHLTSSGDLWQKDSPVARGMNLEMPEEVARGSLELVRAWLAQAALSRGREVPTSRIYSAKILHRHQRSVTRYRRVLKDHGFLDQVPQYINVGPMKLGPTLKESRLPDKKNGWEFVWKGDIYRRLPDIVILLGPEGVKDVLANPELVGLPARRYFYSEEQLHRHKARKWRIDSQAMVRVRGRDAWVPIQTNLSSPEKGDYSQNEKSTFSREALLSGSRKGTLLGGFTGAPPRGMISPARGSGSVEFDGLG